jgi:hypothetical protein
MKKMKMLSAALIFTLTGAGACLAAETYSGRAGTESTRAGSHGGMSTVQGIAASGQVASGAVAVPFAVSGAAGSVGNDSARNLRHAATAPAGAPLPVSEETVTAGVPPNEALKTTTDARR